MTRNQEEEEEEEKKKGKDEVVYRASYEITFSSIESMKEF